MKLIASQVDILLEQTRSFLTRLEFPSWDEYIEAFSTAIHDLRTAGISSWKLTYISFRPIFILLGILSHYLAILLRIIAKHSIAHGWKAIKEGYYQFRVASVWFIKFQKELPSSAKYAELGALSVLATLWLLRRHVRKYHYAERISKWYSNKKRLALRKYHRGVERVAETSSVLATLLPHLLYLVFAIAIKRVVPSLVTYFATRTYLCSIISFWHPLYLTFSVLGRLLPHLRKYKDAESESEDQTSTKSRKKGTTTPSKLKQQKQHKTELEELRVVAVDLLKYWVVYAILLAIVRTGKLLPIIGQILNVTDITMDTASTTTPAAEGFFNRTTKATGLYSKLRLSGKFVEEVTLSFMIWLRFMPASITGDEVKDNVTNALSPMRPSTSGAKKAPGKVRTESKSGVDKHRPVDILYSKLSPFVLSAMNSSAFLTKRAFGDTRNEGSTFMLGVIQKLQSFLDLFVLVRLIKKETKDWLIVTMVESSALLPALTTLLMPSYFTKYGVIYVSLVVPAGYSISCCNEIQRSSSEMIDNVLVLEDTSRYLQFWMVHAGITLLLASFAPLLAWIPLSTHATWLLWAYVQLESSTLKFYGLFESELGKKSLDETVVVSTTKRIISALPSNVDASEKVEQSEGDDKKKVE